MNELKWYEGYSADELVVFIEQYGRSRECIEVTSELVLHLCSLPIEMQTIERDPLRFS